MPTEEILPIAATPGLMEAQEIAEAVQGLMQNEAVRQTVGSMLAFRRGYAVSVGVLEELVAKVELSDAVRQGVVAHLIAAISTAAGNPFEEKVLLEGFAQTVVPWLAQVLEQHYGEEKEIKATDRRVEEEARRSRSIPLPIDWGDGDGYFYTLARSRSLIVIGDPVLVRWALIQICDYAMTPTAQAPSASVLHLSDAPRRFSSSSYVPLGSRDWPGCANSNSSMGKFIAQHVESRLSRPLDLVVIESLDRCVTNENTFSTGRLKASLAEKRIRPWANMVGCGVVGGLAGGYSEAMPQGSALEALTAHVDVLKIPFPLPDGPYRAGTVPCELYTANGLRGGVFAAKYTPDESPVSRLIL